MNVKEYRLCKSCDTNKTNDIAQVWCKKFKTYRKERIRYIYLRKSHGRFFRF